MSRALRLAVVNSHPIQYFAPLYAFLNRDPELEITALYCSDFSLRGSIDPGFERVVSWDVDLLAGYRSVFLGTAANRRTPRGFWSLICPQVWIEVRSGAYDAVLLHGYGFAVNLLALLAAKTQRLPVLMRSETHLGLQRPRWKRWIRDTLLSIGYRFVDGFLSIGTANRLYYRALGIPDGRIFDVPYAVDNDRFIEAATISSEQRTEVRRRYGLPTNGTVVLYASKLMRRKHPDDVISAIAALQTDGRAVTLLMVGSGEMERELRELAKTTGIQGMVFGGFINQAELPKVLAAVDIFVLPAENEPWGLIVNEAMCAGLPVVVSREVGCVPDLVKDGVNGYTIGARDVGSLVAALARLLADEQERQRMGSASMVMIRGWSYEQCRQGIKAALRQCVRMA